MRTFRTYLAALLGTAVFPLVAPAGPVTFRVTVSEPVVEPGNPHFAERLKSMFGGTQEYEPYDASGNSPRSPFYKLDPAPPTPPDSGERITLDDGRVQVIDVALFRIALQLTDLASGQQGSFEYLGAVGGSWIQEADGTWTVFQDYAVVNDPYRSLTIGAQQYVAMLELRTAWETDIIFTAPPAPAPEPGTIALVATGLLPALRLLRRRG